MATPIALDIDSFPRELRRATGQAVIYFFAPWCQPCQVMKPVFAELARRIAALDVVVGTVDIAQSPTVAQTYGIRSVPTIAIFRWGNLVSVVPGEVSIDDAAERVRQALTP